MSRPDSESAERIPRHVECLAGEIAERNVFRPAALSAAREYIAAEWRRQGYQVSQQWYEAAGQSCANLETARPGSTWQKQILVVGAHYDTLRGSPGADANASGVAALPRDLAPLYGCGAERHRVFLSLADSAMRL